MVLLLQITVNAGEPTTCDLKDPLVSPREFKRYHRGCFIDVQVCKFQPCIVFLIETPPVRFSVKHPLRFYQSSHWRNNDICYLSLWKLTGKSSCWLIYMTNIANIYVHKSKIYMCVFYFLCSSGSLKYSFFLDGVASGTTLIRHNPRGTVFCSKHWMVKNSEDKGDFIGTANPLSVYGCPLFRI